MKVLLDEQPADGNGTPPKAAELAASGKSEREILLERRSKAQTKAIQVLKDGKRVAEETAANALRQAEQLREVQQDSIANAAKRQAEGEKGWGFFV